MADTEAIVKIYGAIDHAAQADPQVRHEIAELLPQYRDPEFRWYDEFQKWLADTGGQQDAQQEPPDAANALAELDQPAEHARLRARRMFAIALAARAFPGNDDVKNAAIAALKMPPGSAGEMTPAVAMPDADIEDRASRLYGLLADKPVPARPNAIGPERAESPGTAWWKELVGEALEEGLVPSSTGMFPRPCGGRMLTVPGVEGPVAVLETEHETDPATEPISFDVATRFIEPVNWQTCRPDFWCEVEAMEDPSLPAGQKRYREVVSTHCGDPKGPGFWARTELVFDFVWVPDKQNPVAAIANYKLAPGRPLPHDRIVVDEGTLVVSKVGGRDDKLLVKTTKRVKFSAPFPSGGLALMMCALGYADVAGNMLACAATRGKDLADKLEAVADALELREEHLPNDLGNRFPGVATNVAAAGGSGQGRAGGLMQEWMNIWARGLRDSASAVERSTYNRPGRPGG